MRRSVVRIIVGMVAIERRPTRLEQRSCGGAGVQRRQKRVALQSQAVGDAAGALQGGSQANISRNSMSGLQPQ